MKETIMPWPPDLSVSFSTPMMCNAEPRCPYCINAQCGIGEGAWDAPAWLRGLLDLGDRYGQMHLGSVSAEPMSNPDLISFLRFLSQEHYVSTSTNLVADAELYKRFFSDRPLMDFCASFHPHLWDGQSAFCDRVSSLRDHINISGLTIVGWPPNIPSIPGWKESFADHPGTAGLHVNIAVFNGYYEGRHYPSSHTPEERLVVCPQDGPSSPRFAGETDLKGRLCRAGYKAINIAENGDVSACFMNPHERLLGNLLRGDVELLDGPAPCENSWCACESMWEFIV
jgi:MoaA/NifB/PqqE/SkfB family radical SAM enzyme